MLDRGLAEEAARLPDELAVGVDLAVLAEIADQVPVERRPVLASRLGEPGAERDVDRAADLLVEEDVARKAVDLVVEPERALAEVARLAVHVEQRVQVVAAPRRLGGDHAAALEAQPDVVDGV